MDRWKGSDLKGQTWFVLIFPQAPQWYLPRLSCCAAASESALSRGGARGAARRPRGGRGRPRPRAARAAGSDRPPAAARDMPETSRSTAAASSSKVEPSAYSGSGAGLGARAPPRAAAPLSRSDIDAAEPRTSAASANNLRAVAGRVGVEGPPGTTPATRRSMAPSSSDSSEPPPPPPPSRRRERARRLRRAPASSSKAGTRLRRYASISASRAASAAADDDAVGGAGAGRGARGSPAGAARFRDDACREDRAPSMLCASGLGAVEGTNASAMARFANDAPAAAASGRLSLVAAYSSGASI